MPEIALETSARTASVRLEGVLLHILAAATPSVAQAAFFARGTVALSGPKAPRKYAERIESRKSCGAVEAEGVSMWENEKMRARVRGTRVYTLAG